MKYIIISAILLLSCVKQNIGENNYTFDKYQMVIDRHSLDTLFQGSRWIQTFDSIYKPETRLAFDTLQDMWWIDCSMLDSLQHLYYTKNGRKIQPSKYPTIK